MHWACKRHHLDIVQYLLQSGADVSIKTHKGELPIQLASSSEIRKLFKPSQHLLDTVPISDLAKEELPIVPNYIKHPIFPYYDVDVDNCSSETIAQSTKGNVGLKSSHVPSSTEVQAIPLSPGFSDLNSKVSTLTVAPKSFTNTQLGKDGMAALSHGEDQKNVSEMNEKSIKIMKARVCDQTDSDFVEVEVPSLTYQSLLNAVCDELEIALSDVAKIRKLPNILVRKDKDVQRLREGQELEIILK